MSRHNTLEKASSYNATESLFIFFYRLQYDVLRQSGRGWFLVPFYGEEIVPQELLVKTLLRTALLEIILGPES